MRLGKVKDNAGSIDFSRSHCGAIRAETHANRQRMTRPLFALLLFFATAAHAQPPSSPKPFQVTEASIAETQQALRDGRTTCRAVVKQYLARIAAYDQTPLGSSRDPDHSHLRLNAIVTLEAAHADRGIRIPSTALYEKDRKSAVWIVKDDQTIELRPIVVIRYDTDSVEVSSGLRSGERIVTAGVHKLLAGQKVRLLPDSGT